MFNGNHGSGGGSGGGGFHGPNNGGGGSGSGFQGHQNNQGNFNQGSQGSYNQHSGQGGQQQQQQSGYQSNAKQLNSGQYHAFTTSLYKNLKQSNTIFHGVVPGKTAYPVGKIELEPGLASPLPGVTHPPPLDPQLILHLDQAGAAGPLLLAYLPSASATGTVTGRSNDGLCLSGFPSAAEAHLLPCAAECSRSAPCFHPCTASPRLPTLCPTTGSWPHPCRRFLPRACWPWDPTGPFLAPLILVLESRSGLHLTYDPSADEGFLHQRPPRALKENHEVRPAHPVHLFRSSRAVRMCVAVQCVTARKGSLSATRDASAALCSLPAHSADACEGSQMGAPMPHGRAVAALCSLEQWRTTLRRFCSTPTCSSVGGRVEGHQEADGEPAAAFTTARQQRFMHQCGLEVHRRSTSGWSSKGMQSTISFFCLSFDVVLAEDTVPFLLQSFAYISTN
ncbi:uncharacterized protein LOC119309063 [Triticum dicoccoides]|uniref:uncharacterized protein LOC119309063 n=1 Tax=Triticum dicoccoides TaxID=85692 RepID=UPI00189155DF|nr:uncharacterized protein LOC119309063 [Triticum dicoccoides]